MEIGNFTRWQNEVICVVGLAQKPKNTSIKEDPDYG
jgi:hypothetical protein